MLEFSYTQDPNFKIDFIQFKNMNFVIWLDVINK